MNIERADTSSIGPQWPPRESSFDRIKGIDNRGIIRDGSRFRQVLHEISCLRDTVILEPKNTLDRVSVRLFVQNDVWLKNLEEIGELGEVVIPLWNTNKEFGDISILYLGANGQTRQSSDKDLEKCFKHVQDAMEREVLSYREVIDRVQSNGFRLAVLRHSVRTSDSGVIDQMYGLYKRFGWNRDEVVDILSKDQNIIAVAFDRNENIVSAGIAETSMVSFQDGNQFRFAEITEAATDDKYQGNGLYSGVAAHLMHELAFLSSTKSIFGGSVDLVFGECNGNEPGVLKAVRSLGRTFAKEISDSLHLPFKGYLPQHVPIAGAARSTKYNDLFPAFIPKRDIARFIRL